MRAMQQQLCLPRRVQMLSDGKDASSVLSPTGVISPSSKSKSEETFGGRGQFAHWNWSECRRIYSDPAANLLDSSRCSTNSCGSLEGYAYEDDVFSDCSDDEYYCGKALDLNNCGWDEWTIPEADIKVHDFLATSKRGEVIFSGYWHGQVWLYARPTQTVEDVRSFAVEVNTLCQIRHENIQLFMGVCLDLPRNSLGIVMSDLKGETLHNHLHQMGHNFTTPSKLKILTQVAEGMEYLHAKNICHGALSTSMITIHKRVCISMAITDTARTMHSSDLVYLPPEDVKELVSRNGQVVLPTRPSYSSDIFAFGSIVYELVTLESPFKNSSPLSIIWQVGNGRSQCLSLLQRGRFKGLISRCWATCQYRRPSFKQIISTVADSLILPRDIHSKFSTSVPNDLCTLGR